MKLKIVSMLTSFILALSFTNIATAKPHERGAYLEGNIGSNYTSFHFWGTDYSEFNSVAANANLGYQFFRYLALETGFTAYNRGLNGVDAALKVILPLELGNNDVSLFGKIGPSYVFDNDSGSLLPYLGLGAAYSVTPNLDVNVQAQGVTVGFLSLGLLSAGLTYHFG